MAKDLLLVLLFIIFGGQKKKFNWENSERKKEKE